MKVFLLYYDRFETATTSKMLDIQHYVLCHNNADKFKCIGEKGTLIETGQPKGIQNNMNYGLSMLEDNEWGIFMSDDMISAKEFVDGKFIKCSANHVVRKLIESLPMCDKIGVKLVGLNTYANKVFMRGGKRYSKYGLIDGKCFAIKKTNFRFHDNISTIPDYYATAYHLNKYKGNLILNNYFINFKRYSIGGLGSETERLPQKIKDVKLIKSIFPDNVSIVEKNGQQYGSHIIIKK